MRGNEMCNTTHTFQHLLKQNSITEELNALPDPKGQENTASLKPSIFL